MMPLEQTREVDVLTLEQRTAMYSMIGKSNDSTFLGHVAGTLRLVGVTFTMTPAKKWRVVTRFLIAPPSKDRADFALLGGG